MPWYTVNICKYMYICYMLPLSKHPAYHHISRSLLETLTSLREAHGSIAQLISSKHVLFMWVMWADLIILRRVCLLHDDFANNMPSLLKLHLTLFNHCLEDWLWILQMHLRRDVFYISPLHTLTVMAYRNMHVM